MCGPRLLTLMRRRAQPLGASANAIWCHRGNCTRCRSDRWDLDNGRCTQKILPASTWPTIIYWLWSGAKATCTSGDVN